MSASATHADDRRRRPEFLVRLGVLIPCTPEDVKQAYMERAKTAHPDHGGSAEAFVQLHQDYERALEYARFYAGRSRWLSVAIDDYLAQEQARTTIEQLGGRVEIEELSWLKSEIGDDFAQVLDKLIGVDFSGSSIDDAALVELIEAHPTLASLRWLSLAGCDVGDGSLAFVARWETLQRLNLSGTRVTGELVELVDRWPRLERLDLRQTHIGWMATRRLRRAAPHVTIEH